MAANGKTTKNRLCWAIAVKEATERDESPADEVGDPGYDQLHWP